MAAQDLTTMAGNSKEESARVVFLVRDTPTQCPLYIGEVSWKYLKGFLSYGSHKILQFGETMGDNSWTKSIRVVILARGTPTQCPLQPNKVSWKSSKGIWVMGRTRFRLQTDGQTDARTITISPEPIGREIKVAKNYDRAASCRIRLFRPGPTACLTALTGPRNILYAQAGLGHLILPKK